MGVGQSELSVKGMTDVFLLLMLAGAGDELQGIKRGLMETADILAINKADGDNTKPAEQAAHTYRSALRLLRASDPGWKPTVLTCSGLTGAGLEDIWGCLQDHRKQLIDTDELNALRQKQGLQWMWSLIDSSLQNRFRSDEKVNAQLRAVEADVLAKKISPATAAKDLLDAFLGRA